MAAQQQVVRVKVPQGATTGSTVQATLPNGQQVKVRLPAGVVPGQVVSIAVQPSPRTTQEVEMKAVRLTVPATIPASGTIRFTLDGTNPTETRGEPLGDGTISMLSVEEAAVMKAISSDGTTADLHTHQFIEIG